MKEKENLSKDIKYEKQNVHFKEFLNELEKESSEKVEKLKKLQEKTQTEISQTSVLFGEDPKSFKFFEFIKLINDFISNFKKSTLKISAEEAKNLKQKIKEDKKSKTQVESIIVKDLQNIRKTVVRKTQARKTHLKNFNFNKEKISDVIKNSLDNTPMIIGDNNLQLSKKVSENKTSRMTQLKNFNFNKDRVSDAPKNSFESKPLECVEEEESTVSSKLLNHVKNNKRFNERKPNERISQERITTYGFAKDEDFNESDEDKYINNVNKVNQNAIGSATKSILYFK